MKKTIAIVMSLAIVLSMALSLTACSSGTPAAAPSTAATSAAAAPEVTKATEAEKTYANLVIGGFVGNPDAYAIAAADLVKAAHPEIEYECIVADTNAREQSLKTAISAGDPPAVGYYWGTRVNSFYNIGMCLDLRPYLDQDLLDRINPAMLAPCLGENGEIWAVPVKTVYHTIYYNVDIFKEYGLEEPETWEDMTKICATLKEHDIFGFATNSASMQDCMYGMTYGELDAKVGPGTAWGVANADVSVAPGSEAGEVIRECIEQVDAWYKAGYWYPGDGGINCTADDANAAFAQGRCAMIMTFSGALSSLSQSCDFEIGTFMKPVSDASFTSEDNIEPDVYFIPSNASEEQINIAVEFIKTLLSEEVQQTLVDRQETPSMNYDYKNVTPLLAEVINELSTGRTVSGLNPCRTSSEMQTFVKTTIFAGPLGGAMTIDEALTEMERIRLEAANK